MIKQSKKKSDKDSISLREFQKGIDNREMERCKKDPLYMYNTYIRQDGQPLLTQEEYSKHIKEWEEAKYSTTLKKKNGSTIYMKPIQEGYAIGINPYRKEDDKLGKDSLVSITKFKVMKTILPEYSDHTGIRKSGQTTRLVDKYIQDLFNGEEVYPRDNYTRSNSYSDIEKQLVKRIMGIIANRLYSEHRIDSHSSPICLYKNMNKLTLQLKIKKDEQ